MDPWPLNFDKVGDRSHSKGGMLWSGFPSSSHDLILLLYTIIYY